MEEINAKSYQSIEHQNVGIRPFNVDDCLARSRRLVLGRRDVAIIEWRNANFSNSFRRINVFGVYFSTPTPGCNVDVRDFDGCRMLTHAPDTDNRRRK